MAGKCFMCGQVHDWVTESCPVHTAVVHAPVHKADSVDTEPVHAVHKAVKPVSLVDKAEQRKAYKREWMRKRRSDAA